MSFTPVLKIFDSLGAFQLFCSQIKGLAIRAIGYDYISAEEHTAARILSKEGFTSIID